MATDVELWRGLCLSLCRTDDEDQTCDQFLNRCMTRARRSDNEYEPFLLESGILQIEYLMRLIEHQLKCAVVSFDIPGSNLKKHVVLTHKGLNLYPQLFILPAQVRIEYNPSSWVSKVDAARMLLETIWTPPKPIIDPKKQPISVHIRSLLSKYAKFLVETEPLVTLIENEGYSKVLEETVLFLHEFDENPERAELNYATDRVLIGLHLMLLDNAHFITLSMRLFKRILPIDFSRLLNMRSAKLVTPRNDFEIKPRQGSVVHSPRIDTTIQHMKKACHSATKLRRKVNKKYHKVFGDYRRWLLSNDHSTLTEYVALCFYFHLLHPVYYNYDCWHLFSRLLYFEVSFTNPVRFANNNCL